jgi:hypothetical protein
MSVGYVLPDADIEIYLNNILTGNGKTNADAIFSINLTKQEFTQLFNYTIKIHLKHERINNGNQIRFSCTFNDDGRIYI